MVKITAFAAMLAVYVCNVSGELSLKTMCREGGLSKEVLGEYSSTRGFPPLSHQSQRYRNFGPASFRPTEVFPMFILNDGTVCEADMLRTVFGIPKKISLNCEEWDDDDPRYELYHEGENLIHYHEANSDTEADCLEIVEIIQETLGVRLGLGCAQGYSRGYGWNIYSGYTYPRGTEGRDDTTKDGYFDEMCLRVIEYMHPFLTSAFCSECSNHGSTEYLGPSVLYHEIKQLYTGSESRMLKTSFPLLTRDSLQCTCDRGYRASGYTENSKTHQWNYKCTECPAGTFQPYNAFDGTQCTPQTKCSTGEYISAESKTEAQYCKACPDGKFMDKSNHREKSCNEQDPCQAGEKYSADSENKRECTPCADLTYQPSTSHKNQTCPNAQPPCSVGKYLVDSKIAERNCSTCYARAYQNATSHVETSCTRQPYCSFGEYFEDSTTAERECSKCPPFTFQPRESHTESDCLTPSFANCSGGGVFNQTSGRCIVKYIDDDDDDDDDSAVPINPAFTIDDDGNGPGIIIVVVFLATTSSCCYILMMIQSIIPWKAPVARKILKKLGLLWCFEIDYPTQNDPNARQIEVNTVLYRKSVEKCGCISSIIGGLCTIHGPTVSTALDNDIVDPSTSLFDPMTKLYRYLGLPGTNHGCGKWCSVHGPNPDANNDNILFAPGAAIMEKCCGEPEMQSTATTSQFGFVDKQPKENPLFEMPDTTIDTTAATDTTSYLEVVGTAADDRPNPDDALDEVIVQSSDASDDADDSARDDNCRDDHEAASTTVAEEKAAAAAAAKAAEEQAAAAAAAKAAAAGKESSAKKKPSAKKGAPDPSTASASPGFKKADVGQRVTVQGYDGVKGTIRFVGKHAVEKTRRVGVELDKPVGKSNGTVKGHVYFKCDAKHGVLVKPEKVTLVKKKKKTIKAAP
eukprot:gene16960-16888_t